MRLVGALLGVALLLLAGCGRTAGTAARSPSETTAAPTASARAGPAHLTRARCADLVVLGLRGQGQSPRGHHGAGRDVDGVARSMVAHLPRGTTMRVDGVPFAARSGDDAAYNADVRAGVRLVRARLASLAAQCPRSRAALIGYSQGAEVVHRSAAALAAPAQVAVVVLMGDPLRTPSDPVPTLRPTGALGGRGNSGPGARFPEAIRARVLEVCARLDDVCNAPLSGRIGPPSPTHHTVYKTPGVQSRVAAEAARVAVGAGG